MGCLAWPGTEIEQYRPRLYVPGPLRPPRRPRRWWERPAARPARLSIAHALTDKTNTVAANGATIQIQQPTGASSANVLVCVFGIDSSAATPGMTPPTGWTRIGPSSGLNQTAGANHAWVTAFWSLGGNSNLTFTNTNTGDSQSWVCAAFSGVDTTTPIDVQDTTGSSNTGQNSLTINAVTIATANAWELIACCDWNSGTFSATNFTVSESSTANCAAAVLYNTTPLGTGSTGTVTLSDSAATSGNIMVGFSFALRPAGAGTSFVPAAPVAVLQSVANAAYF